MDKYLKRMLGLEDEGKRQYRFVSGEVTREEFEYCQLLDILLFGQGGYVETLGPVWDMVHDPRFSKIENAFIVNRRAVFGGDAMTGKQYISSDGTFTSTIADLEQYSETLGEGRYFLTVIEHPDKDCPLRHWYLRIFPDMLQKEGVKAPIADENLKCGCVNKGDSRIIKDANDEVLWAIIKQECPNYFNRGGDPNGMAQRLFDLFRADLLGLIADYAMTPISDVYIELDTGDVMAPTANEAPPHIFLEVDILEKALTQRAVLRATAAKILRQMGFHRILRSELGGDIRLTDIERDQLLRMVYEPREVAGIQYDPSTNWFGFLHLVEQDVLQFLRDIKNGGRSFEDREKEQLGEASANAHKVFAALSTGQMELINQYTEPEVDVQLDPHAEIMQAILKNPLKQELFMIWVEAERRSSESKDTDKLNMHRLYSMLTPIFTDANFLVTEESFNEYIDEATKLGFFGEANIEAVEEQFHGKDSDA